MFDESAREVMLATQAEAVRSRSGAIQPRHVLLALMRVRRGGGAHILHQLGVRAPALRTALKLHPAPAVLHPAGRMTPTAQTRRVLDEAVQWAREHGSEKVRSEHLLAGLFCDASDPACLALADVGVTAERAAPLVEELDRFPRRRRGKPAIPAPVPGLAATGGLQAAIQRARASAVREAALFFRTDHLLSQLLALDSPTPALLGLLEAVGADLGELRRRLRPPARVTRLEAEIRKLQRHEDDAVGSGDEASAQRLLDAERKLRHQLEVELDAWNTSWARPLSR
jgi:ATP-dependent Clp protease ATP-binding subunit ClpA